MRRFRPGHSYDPEMDHTTWGTKYNPQFIMRNASPLQKAFIRDKAAQSLRRISAKRRAASVDQREAREQAEARCADLIRQVVQALEFAMTEMMEHQPRGQYQKSVNQHFLAKVLWDLKTKCGVKFTDSEFNPYPARKPIAPDPDNP
jgi:hypothetical protein